MKKNNHPETQMYKAFVQEFSLRHPKYIDYLCRFEHGGYKINFAEQKDRKQTLLRAGIPDYGFFYAVKPYTMLWIEFKVKPNRLTLKQKEMRAVLTSWGAKHVTCYSAQEGIKEIELYLISITKIF